MHTVFQYIYYLVIITLIACITVYDDIACGTLHTFAMIFYIVSYAIIAAIIVLGCILLVFKFSNKNEDDKEKEI